jgi:hypothetical protein
MAVSSTDSRTFRHQLLWNSFRLQPESKPL